MSARERILARLRAAPVIPEPPPASAAAAPAMDRATLLGDFCAAIGAAHAEIHHTDDAGWPDLLLRLCREKQVNTLLVGSGTAHGDRLATVAADTPRLLAYDRPAAEWKTELFENVDAGFTAARCAIAETGSLVLWPDEHEPRLLSLVPPIHFVLLDAAAIEPTLQSVMVRQDWGRGLPTNALLISGPSKTSDIQQTLAYGAHGPKELVVLVRAS
ncbi:MAG: lactate utilization protein [Rhodocyclaceae bacterium]|nr:lactate utilization protein [Rhodocyclaceae bacterium]